jgi:diaminopimelate decarboxylase
MFALIDRLMLSGISIKHFDLGGGMGVRYENEPEFPLEALRAALEQRLNDRNLQLVIEPGRYLVANAGVLLTKVIHTKANHEKQFAVVDAAMNDLLRPALYGAVQEVLAVQEPMETGAHTIDVVGPICETGDFLAKDCSIDLKADDLIAICSAGAYGMSMSSNYNTRGRAAEVLVEGGQARLVRTRESVEMQLALEIEHLDKPSTTEH